ncbi:hypothetical protein [Rhodoferax sp. BLA1]|uniref:hypothetical protein n=1 Tax=Rhodoferax sp. BLA1 TaxID=2576062 RepID=UPI0015D407CE|nr:hypothetical protein [Rhodoferax sp. BLA1]
MYKTTTNSTAFNLLQRTLSMFALWILSLGALSACAVAPGGLGGGDTWQEEVLLHDGRTIVADRFVRRGGRAEVGQAGAYVEQKLSFTVPDSGQIYNWSDSYSAELGMSNFLLLALDVVDNVPYIVADPMGCQSYNKWGRPNPPYVVFKWQDNTWQRIAIEQLPRVVARANLIHSMPDKEIRRLGTRRATSGQIQKLNASDQPQYQSILREPMTNGGNSCRLEFTNGKGIWLSADWFSGKQDLQSCVALCKREEFSEEACPCTKFFKGE